jgi:hypothetical protein
MEDYGILYKQVDYFTAIRNILWSFGIISGNLVSFPRFGILFQEKSGNPVNEEQKKVELSRNLGSDHALAP